LTVRSGRNGGLRAITRRLKVCLEVGGSGIVKIFWIQVVRIKRLRGDLRSLRDLGLALTRGAGAALVGLGLLRGRPVVLGLGWRDGGDARRVGGGRGCRSSHRLVGGRPRFIVDSMVKHLLESTHVKVIGDAASWAGPERRLMVIRPLVHIR
jgi:hypothetical protein